MGLLFFNSDSKDIEKVANDVFSTLEIFKVDERESENVLNGVYYSFSIFGMTIRLESNSYDYEDEYYFMISVRKNLLSTKKTDKIIEENLTVIVARLLLENLKIEIAQEQEGGNLFIHK